MECTHPLCERGLVRAPERERRYDGPQWKDCPTCKGMGELCRNIRFWAFINLDYVKITLKPGECWEHWDNHITDEGYHNEVERWRYELPDRINLESHTYSADCDGPHEDHSYTHILIGDEDKGKDAVATVYNHDTCEIEEVDRAIDSHGATIRMPKYSGKRAWQRDIYAERMGY